MKESENQILPFEQKSNLDKQIEAIKTTEQLFQTVSAGVVNQVFEALFENLFLTVPSHFKKMSLQCLLINTVAHFQHGVKHQELHPLVSEVVNNKTSYYKEYDFLEYLMEVLDHNMCLEQENQWIVFALMLDEYTKVQVCLSPGECRMILENKLESWQKELLFSLSGDEAGVNTLKVSKRQKEPVPMKKELDAFELAFSNADVPLTQEVMLIADMHIQEFTYPTWDDGPYVRIYNFSFREDTSLEKISIVIRYSLTENGIFRIRLSDLVNSGSIVVQQNNTDLVLLPGFSDLEKTAQYLALAKEESISNKKFLRIPVKVFGNVSEITIPLEIYPEHHLFNTFKEITQAKEKALTSFNQTF